MAMRIYETLVRPALFRIDPERAHAATLKTAGIAASMPGVLSALERRRKRFPVLECAIGPLSFPSPIGLSAGFDKDGRAVDITSRLGFGFVEIGSVTAAPWRGNDGPRLARLPRESAVWSRYGLKSEGAVRVARRLARARAHVPLAVNVAAVHAGRTDFGLDTAISELCDAFSQVAPCAQFGVLNMACPNTEGRDLFAEPEAVARLLDRVEAAGPSIPVFLKLRHRADRGWIEEMVTVARRRDFVLGLVPSAQLMRELSHGPEFGPLAGTVTGPPVRAASVRAIAQWREAIGSGPLSLFAAGGMASGADAYEAIRAGASLVKLFTPLVYAGPGLPARINADLAGLLERAGFGAVSEAIGAGTCP